MADMASDAVALDALAGECFVCYAVRGFGSDFPLVGAALHSDVDAALRVTLFSTQLPSPHPALRIQRAILLPDVRKDSFLHRTVTDGALVHNFLSE